MSWSEGGWVLPLAGIVITIPAAIGYHVGRLYLPPTTFITMSVGGIVGVVVLAHILSSLTDEGGADTADKSFPKTGRPNERQRQEYRALEVLGEATYWRGFVPEGYIKPDIISMLNFALSDTDNGIYLLRKDTLQRICDAMHINHGGNHTKDDLRHLIAMDLDLPYDRGDDRNFRRDELAAILEAVMRRNQATDRSFLATWEGDR